MNINIRYFASAAAAAGLTEDSYTLAENSTIATLIDEITTKHASSPNGGDLARILSFSSFLLNGRHADHNTPIPAGDVSIDVLPPFAGG
ncbi:molybdopterin converting factor small subunit [Arcanobacterium pluranimalium]|uniref:MoaD/ThiS family protein n=1 Tax=Arcanobacterium pluranimalium TaxID=108028 RepID=UPI00195E5EF5|nr:MoaD/ThiS family protein [Arcanobacterium pluranimalium]MBM7824545.1 molybdopterin converting factor small subunit [Arcanobacterium pluranimalium]